MPRGSRYPNGEEIRRLRNSRGWTQKELAEKCDQSEEWIGKVERVTGKADYEPLERLADVFGVSFDSIAIPVNLEAQYLKRRKQKRPAAVTGKATDGTLSRDEQITRLCKQIIELLGPNPLLDALDGSVKLIYALTPEEIGIVQDAIERGELKGEGVEIVDARAIPESDPSYEKYSEAIKTGHIAEFSVISTNGFANDITSNQMASPQAKRNISWTLLGAMAIACTVLFAFSAIYINMMKAQINRFQDEKATLILERDISRLRFQLLQRWTRLKAIANRNGPHKQEIEDALTKTAVACGVVELPNGIEILMVIDDTGLSAMQDQKTSLLRDIATLDSLIALASPKKQN
jgi:transcriptional regulator with XRE-family HTH domain